jgi:hypothetical protein
MISKIEVERFTLSSSKPFDQVVAALNSAVGHADVPEFWQSTHRAQSVAELESTSKKAWLVMAFAGPYCSLLPGLLVSGSGELFRIDKR